MRNNLLNYDEFYKNEYYNDTLIYLNEKDLFPKGPDIKEKWAKHKIFILWLHALKEYYGNNKFDEMLSFYNNPLFHQDISGNNYGFLNLINK